MIRRIELQGRNGKFQIEYNLTRKRVKNLNLRIKPDLSVHVSANNSLPLAVIDDFLISKSDFILNALQRYSGNANLAPAPLRCADGEKVSFFGEPLELQVIKSGKNGAARNGNCLILTVTDPENADLRARILESFLKAKCLEVMTDICRKIYPDFQKYGVIFPQIKLRKMTSRWGSCNPSRGTVTFNTRLSEHPLPFAEYVAVHEFTHLLHPDHSKRFWAKLAEVMPDYKERKRL